MISIPPATSRPTPVRRQSLSDLLFILLFDLFYLLIDLFFIIIIFAELTPRAGEWDTFMRTFQQKVAEAAPEDEWWSPMPEVFDLETQLAALPTSE